MFNTTQPVQISPCIEVSDGGDYVVKSVINEVVFIAQFSAELHIRNDMTMSH